MKRAKTRDNATNEAVQLLIELFEKSVQEIIVDKCEFKNEVDIDFISRQALNGVLLLRKL